MAGLLNSLGQQFTPEKQERAKRAWQIGRNLIYKEGVFDSILPSIQANPAQGLGEAIVMVLKKIDEGMGRMSYDVALAAGLMLLDDIADAVSQTGKVKIDTGTTEEALKIAIQLYLQSYGAANNKEQLNQAMMAMQGEMPEQEAPRPQGGLLQQGMR